MKEAYPVFVKECGNDYLVYVPDTEIYTEGKSLVDAIEMARDAIGLKGLTIEDDKKEIPAPSTMETAYEKAKADADEDFDYSDRAVRKNVTIPNWLNIKAEEMGINFSKVLQEALKERIYEE